ncbi:MAG: DUF1501 domain-containing protein [Pirellulaceae bacterium]|nr:DUF1501 domain-containing protein [Pirellulaceae bacterium]MDP7019828.1 DUF1501 domain-containing protein [Pirellulaceae bacterium]
MHRSLCKPWEHRLSRRQWLGGAAAGAVGAASAATPWNAVVAEEMKKQDRQVLFIWLDGGLSQLESWDPKPGTQFGGPFRSIQTTLPGIRISELMPKSAQQMQHLAVVRSVATQDNSHSAGVARIQRGDPKDRGVVYPYFGSAVAKLLGPGPSKLPPYVWIKPGSGGFLHKDAGFLGPKFGALAFGDGKPPANLLRPESIGAADDAARQRLRENANRRYSTGRRRQVSDANSYVFDTAQTLMERSDLFNASSFDERDLERYGKNDFGRHMLQSRKMLEAGVRFVKVNSYGWDTHGDNFNGHLSLVAKFDRAFAAVIEDLAERGMLEHVLVIAMSEFGRTPRINGHIGRDHWPEAWSVAMAGSGIKSGVVVGETNEAGTFVKSDPYDIGHMFHTWFRALGIDSDEVGYTNNGQPLPIAHDEMGPIKELLTS